MSIVGDDERLEVLLNGNQVVHIANLDTTENAHDEHDLSHSHTNIVQLHSNPMQPYQDDGMNDLHDAHMMNEIQYHDHSMVDTSSHIHNIHHHHKTWHEYFLELKSLATHGKANIQPGRNPGLDQWISEQRSMYQEIKLGHETELTHERRVLLDAIGFRWESPMEEYELAPLNSSEALNDEELFHSRCAELLTFKEIHGHSVVPVDYEDNPELGKWSFLMRDLFIKKILPQEHYNVLVQLGFDFIVPGQTCATTFEERIKQIKSFKSVYSHTKIPMRWSVDPTLHDWILEQKLQLERVMDGKEHDLTDTQRKAILDLDIDFDYYEPSNLTVLDPDPESGRTPDMNRSCQWDAMYQELREYRLIHGHSNVPRRSKRDPSKDALGEWVHFQRRQHRNLFTGKNSTLTLARKKALDVIEFQWEKSSTTYCTDINGAIEMIIQNTPDKLYNEQWYERLHELSGYMETYQSSHVDFNLNPILALWVQKQRKHYKAWKQKLGSDHLHDRRFDHDKYHSLLAIHFDFEGPSLDSVRPEDHQIVSDDPDYIEIFGGIEDYPSALPQLQDSEDHYNYMSPHDLISPQDTNFSRTELNESDVHMILVGGREEDRLYDDHDMSHQVPMPNIGNNYEAHEHGVDPEHDHGEQHNNDHFPQELPQSKTSAQQKNHSTNQRRVMIKVRVDWEERVLELIQYKNRKHHIEVKRKVNPELADWVLRQKLQYLRFIRGQPSSLTVRRIEILSELGFDYSIQDADVQLLQKDDFEILELLESKGNASFKISKTPSNQTNGRFKEAKWLESLSKVVRFKEKFGTCNVPRKWREDVSLGEWVHFQRRQYRLRQLGKRTHLSDERVEKLNAIGFEWSRVSPSQPSFVPNNRIMTLHGTMMSSISDANDEGQNDHEGYDYGVPSDVSQMVLDDQEKAAAEIAAVVAEHLNNPTNHLQNDDDDDDEEKKHFGDSNVQV